MVKEHTIMGEERGETQEIIDICEKCDLPASKCNGECERYKAMARKIRKAKRLKKNIVVY